MFGEALGSIGALGPSGAGLAAGGMMGLQTATSLYNVYQQERQFDYEKNLQNKVFRREDSAIQRRVRDLQAAGLSPVLAAGNGANAGAVVHTNAPQVNDDIASKFMGLIKMANDIGISRTQQELMEEQKRLASDQGRAARAAAWASNERAETEKWDREYWAGRGQPTNAGGLAKSTSTVGDIARELKNKALGSGNNKNTPEYAKEYMQSHFPDQYKKMSPQQRAEFLEFRIHGLGRYTGGPIN